MHPQHFSRRQSTLAPFLLLALFGTLCVVGVVSGTGQSDRKEEREVQDKIPAHLPIKIKIKNAEKVKDLKNDGWIRDLELEVKNTGTKPIYYLRVSLFFVDVEFSPGERYGFALVYGRPELVDFAERITPQDVPLMPGETHVFRISESLVKGWNHHRARTNKPQPKKLGVDFHELNFGDGTGFATTGGLPVPNLPKSLPSRASRAAQPRVPSAAGKVGHLNRPSNSLPSYRRTSRR